MIRFEGRIVQFGFGAVGKSFFEKISREIQYDENRYFVVTMDRYEFEAYVNMGGLVSNFIVAQVNRENFVQVFAPLLKEGDILIDFADTVGTLDICTWCAKNNIMYLNTGEADWPDNWYSIFTENERKSALKEKSSNQHPIVLQHGNNPGLVSHFVKAAFEYVVKTQFGHDKELKKYLKEGRFNRIAQKLEVKMIHVNDVDLQKIKGDYDENMLYSTWCTDSFWFEMLSEATVNVGTSETIDPLDDCKFYDEEKGYLEFKKLAADKVCRTYYPGGGFQGFLVPHEETITIAKSLEVKENKKTVYRPTVMFIYSPCSYATEYFKSAKVNDYPDADPKKPADVEDENGNSIIRGYVYPQNFEIIYQEKLLSGTEYVGILLMGETFDPVWVGNRVTMQYLSKNKKDCYWQTPTITPVAMSALSALKWMIQNKDKGGIYFPDDIKDYKSIIKTAEKYISKTIYQTFSKEEVEKQMGISFQNIKMQDVFVK